jgi:hypothetical protein
MTAAAYHSPLARARYIVERRHGWLWRSWRPVLTTGDAEEAYDTARAARGWSRRPVRVRQILHGVSIILREMQP